MRWTVFLAAALLASCATVPPQMLPMILASDEGWSGRITQVGLDLQGLDRPVSVARAQHLSHGGGHLLLNSPTDQGEYISVWVQLEPCQAGGRSYPYSISACVAPHDARDGCRMRLKGCAIPADARFRSRAGVEPAGAAR